MRRDTAPRLARSRPSALRILARARAAAAVHPRSYAGHLTVAGTSPVWVPPRVQLIFSVAGTKYDGIATAEATKVNGGLDFTFVGLDVMNSAETRILVAGDAQRMAEKKDALRELVDFKARTRKA